MNNNGENTFSDFNCLKDALVYADNSHIRDFARTFLVMLKWTFSIFLPPPNDEPLHPGMRSVLLTRTVAVFSVVTIWRDKYQPSFLKMCDDRKNNYGGGVLNLPK